MNVLLIVCYNNLLLTYKIAVLGGLNLKNTSNLNDRVYSILKDMLTRDEFAQGEIYSESKVAEQIFTSRTPVRDAIHKLEAEGFIDIIPSKGFVIHKITPAEIILNYQQRAAIEGYSVFNLTKYRDNDAEKKVIKELDECVSLHLASITNKDEINIITKYDHDFHLKIVEYVNNHVFNSFFDRLFSLIFRSCAVATETRNGETRMLASHMEILDKIKYGTPAQAYDSVLKHLEDAMKLNYEVALSEQKSLEPNIHI